MEPLGRVSRRDHLQLKKSNKDPCISIKLCSIERADMVIPVCPLRFRRDRHAKRAGHDHIQR